MCYWTGNCHFVLRRQIVIGHVLRSLMRAEGIKCVAHSIVRIKLFMLYGFIFKKIIKINRKIN